MPQAKAIINLKEGIIELEGPVEFVRHYLNTYRSAVSPERLSQPQLGEPRIKKTRNVKGLRGGVGRRARRGSTGAAIRDYLKSGLFDKPLSISQVRQRLSDAGSVFTDNTIRSALKKLVGARSLEKLGRGRGTRYRSLGRS